MHLFFLWIGEGFGGKYSEAPKTFAKPEAAEGFTKQKNRRERKRSRPSWLGQTNGSENYTRTLLFSRSASEPIIQNACFV